MKNRKMNKKLVAVLTLAGVISFFGSDLEVKRTPAVVTLEKIMKEKKVQATGHAIPVREPGSETIIKLPEVPLNIAKPDYSGTKHSALPDSYEIADHIFAIRTSEYNLMYGAKVQDKNGYTFFTAKEKPQHSNIVVIDQSTKKLYLVSSVLKLENVTEDLRNDLVSKGIDEHYYSTDLKIMYVQSTQDELFNTHEELKAHNVTPQVELIRNFHRPI